jgi:hypothetical protein
MATVEVEALVPADFVLFGHSSPFPPDGTATGFARSSDPTLVKST